ncbi:MAG: LPS-assembly protein LptD [Pseudomonadales bacterium]
MKCPFNFAVSVTVPTWTLSRPLQLALIAALFSGWIAPLLADPVKDELASRYWVPTEQLDPSTRALLPEYCRGTYVTPRATVPANIDPGALPVEADALKGIYWLKDRAELSGEVSIRQGDRVVTTPSARIDLNTRQVTVDESVTVADPSMILAGDQAQMDIDTKAVTLTGVEYLLADAAMRGDAKAVARNEVGDLRLTGSRITRCPPGHRGWHFGASQIDVGNGDIFAIARNAVLRVGGVPIFYAPAIRFPVSDERQSGWLFPSIAYSAEDGADVSLPYYWNLAPNYDATIVPRYMDKRGLGLETEFRHRSNWSETILTGAMLPSDDLYDGKFAKDDFEALFPGERFDPEDRWLYAMEHLGIRDSSYGQFRTIVDYTAVSDRDYFRDLGSDLGVSSQIELERRGELQFTRGDLQVRLWAQRFQRLDEISVDPYERVPELELSYERSLFGPLRWSIGSEWAAFDRDTDGLSGTNAITGSRFHAEPRLRLPLSWPYGFLDMQVGYRYTRYDLDDHNAAGLAPDFDESPDRSIGFGRVDAGLIFERDVRLFGTGLIQTLEPRAYYLNQAFEDQQNLPLFDTSVLTFQYSQLYRDNRFAGLDRIGDADQLSTGLTTRFLNARDGREYLRASVGQIWYFRDRDVTLVGEPTADDRHGTSALAGELAATIARHWRAQASVVWDPDDDEVELGGASISYQPESRKILNLGYRFDRIADIDQTDFSLYWPLTRHFSFVGRWNYDLASGRTIERFGGLEYNDCCWQIRLLARRFIDSPSAALIDEVEADEGVFVQIVFKGLAGFGNKLESVLTRGVKGYRSPEVQGILSRSQ